MTRPLPVQNLRTNTRELDLEKGQKVYHLPDWHNLSHPERLTVIRQIAMMRGRDPRIAQLALSILKKANVKPREYKKQAAALLAWVQNPKNVYYVNEPGERLQDPVYTIKVGHGDCDDLMLLLAALCESIALPWKLCLSGRHKPSGKKVRYIEGQPVPNEVAWVHIYGMVGDRPFRPTKWYFVEPTVQGVPLGWDVVDGDERYLPEMARSKSSNHPPHVVRLKPPPMGHRNKSVIKGDRSPALDYGDALVPSAPAAPPRAPVTGQAIGTSVGAGIAATSPAAGFPWMNVAIVILTGVGTSLLLDFINGRGIWEGKGPIHRRLHGSADTVASASMFATPLFSWSK